MVGSGSLPGFGAIETSAAPAGRAGGAPVYVEAADPLAPAVGGAALGATLVVLFGIFVLTSAMAGYRPGILQTFAEYSLWVLAGIGLVVSIVFFVIGLIIGKATTR